MHYIKFYYITQTVASYLSNLDWQSSQLDSASQCMRTMQRQLSVLQVEWTWLSAWGQRPVDHQSTKVLEDLQLPCLWTWTSATPRTSSTTRLKWGEMRAECECLLRHTLPHAVCIAFLHSNIYFLQVVLLLHKSQQSSTVSSAGL